MGGICTEVQITQKNIETRSVSTEVVPGLRWLYFIANMIALVRIKGTRHTKTLNGGLKCEKQEKN